METATTSRTRKKGDAKHVYQNAFWTARVDLAGGRERSADLASENTAPATRRAQLSKRYPYDSRRQEGQVLRRSPEGQDRHYQLHVHQVSGDVSRHDC